MSEEYGKFRTLYGLGMVWAFIISIISNSFGTALFHGLLSWFYLGYALVHLAF